MYNKDVCLYLVALPIILKEKNQCLISWGLLYDLITTFHLAWSSASMLHQNQFWGIIKKDLQISLDTKVSSFSMLYRLGFLQSQGIMEVA